MDMSVVLPEECISNIISLTCARDACRFSAVSSGFKSAADAVWEMFLPSDYREIISNSASLSLLSKKDIYLHLSSSTTVQWFAQVAELNGVVWFEVKGEIDTKILSPKTTYAAYFVFKLAEDRKGFRRRLVELGVYLAGMDKGDRRKVLLDPPRNTPTQCVNRGDGWMEIEMGEFFSENGDDGSLICSVFDFADCKLRMALSLKELSSGLKMVDNIIMYHADIS